MKKKILLLTIFFIIVHCTLIIGNCFSQWFWQNPFPQGNDLASVKFINENTGWASGDRGTIIKTTNAGISWSLQYGICDFGISGLCFVNSLTGFAFSGSNLYNSSKFLKTTNSGQNWVAISFSNIFGFTDLCFVNANTGYLSGIDFNLHNGVLLKTTNGGNNWTNIFISPYQNIGVNGIYVYNNNIIFASSGNNYFHKTTNAGINWSTFNIGYNIIAIYFPDTLNGISIGGFSNEKTNSGIIFKTSNGGINFYSVLICPGVAFSSYSFINPQTGYVAGNLGTIQKTTNLGTNWNILNSNTNELLMGINFPNVNTGYSVGIGGNIIKSTNAGTNWQMLTKGVKNLLYSTYFLNENTGFVAGNYIILKTNNGGVNWMTKLDTNLIYVQDITFINNNTGFALSSTPSFFNSVDTYFLKTTNGGENWKISLIIAHNDPMPSNYFVIKSLSMLNENTGWICGGKCLDSGSSFHYYGVLMKTTNGGLNWMYNERTDSSYSKIIFFDNSNGILFNDKTGIYKTTNSGSTWNKITFNQNSVFFGCCSFVNSNTGWVSYYNIYSPKYSWIYKTTDGGGNWISKNTISGSSIVTLCADINDNIWAVGASDTYLGSDIYASSNGGDNWILQKSPADYKLYDIKFVNTNTGWTVGDNGTILKTINGITSGIKPSSQIIPKSYILFQNYPNPFNPTTIIRYQIKDSRFVTLKVYDILGREIATLVNEFQKAGTYETQFPDNQYTNNQLPSGVYFYQLKTDNFIETKKMILIK